MLFDKVKPEHILHGIKDYKEKGLPNGFGPSTTYNLVHDGENYPPKAVMAYANFHASGRKIERYFKGGEGTECFDTLLQNGFEIKEKSETTESSNVKEAFAIWLLKQAPESYKKMYLGYTKASIVERLTEIDSFFDDLNLFEVTKENVTQKIETIKHKIGRKERANNPEFQKYDSGKGSGIPKAVIGKKNYFKFLEEYFKDVSYWIFQGNPSIYNITNALRGGHLKSWKVAAHKDKIKPGDKVIIWQTGDHAGCYALAEVTSEVGVFEEEAFELQHYMQTTDKENASNTDRVKLKITTYLADNPILWSAIKNKPEFANFKAGNQGTNFSATSQEYNTLLNMAENTRFSWVKTHKEIAQYLLNQETNQKELIKLLQNAGATEFNDKDEQGNTIELQEIDPFTFFCYIYKYGPKRRLEILQNIAKVLHFSIPTDDSGIPSSNAQKVWLFPYQAQRQNNEIQRLWQLFKDAMHNRTTNKQFEDALTINSTGKTVLTEGLFNIDPERYFPINKPTKPFLEQKFGINPKFNTYTEYLNILEQLKAKTKTPFYQLSYEAWLWNNQPKKEESTIKNNNIMETPLNQLFYGPPGTGKTYGTIAEAIKIVDNDFFKANESNREALTKRYQELLITDWKEANGQIAFCTFHQSFTYEDFVEGIKPKTTQNKDIYYDIEPGIFKRICDLADSSKSTIKVKNEGTINWSENEFRKAFFYKLSLGEANNPEDREIYEFCRDNDYISIGFAGDHDLAGKSESEIKQLCEDISDKPSAGSQLSTFIHGVSIGDYVLISKGNLFVRALAKVVGNYEYHDDFAIGYNHFRKVEWVFTDENIPIEEIYHTTLMQRSIYRIDHDKLKKDFFVKDSIHEIIPNETIKPYVIVIDEINRGNVASIFGELITLIEPDKRTGADEELQVILPYSKEKFSVPDNVYIIGTMNTADRSIEALDSALRRRFSFTEVKPNPSIIDEVLKEKAIWNSVSLSLILETINKRITVLIDRDHQIGHSYFLKLTEVQVANFGNALKAVFAENIIPLLQEYFFNDYVKIGMILGSGFIKVTPAKENLFAEIEDSLEDDYSDAKEYEFTNLETLDDNQFKIILNKLLNK
ncbi:MULTISPECIES: EVE domain-containing protein [Flavobacteriaceae]|uniref:EVE domain-containing protein n=1 Tax=Flavobacteriaceae TaxID=49546 RepID=UPI003A8FF08D